MSALPKIQPYFTIEEYFAHEERAEHRNEYYQGEIFAMSGGSANHNRVIRNMVALLTNALAKTRCEVFATDLRLFVKRDQLYTYPDLMVICGRLIFAPGRMDTVTNPVIIVEVLSPSTENYDRGKKFEFYRALETLQEYILVDQERFYVEHYRRNQSASWILTTYGQAQDAVKLLAVDVEIPLAAIYERVEWEQE